MDSLSLAQREYICEGLNESKALLPLQVPLSPLKFSHHPNNLPPQQAVGTQVEELEDALILFWPPFFCALGIILCIPLPTNP